MDNDAIINQLKRSFLRASCSSCGYKFDLSKSTIFDGLAEFPDLAQLKKTELIEQLKERISELNKKETSAKDAEKKAIEVGVGKIIEKILPAYEDFNMPLPDCRPLFEPIDLIVFNGATKMNVDSITFLEIKTGKSRLNSHQKSVQEAVEKRRVRYEEVK